MNWEFIGQLGMMIGFAMGVLGSALGVWAAGTAAAGAWARDARAGKRINFSYVIFIAAPMSQTIYAFIVMNAIAGALKASPAMAGTYAGQLLGVGIATGLGEMVSAWVQGIIGAAACRCLSDSDGKGFAFLVIAIGIIETAGIFTLAFMLGMVPKVGG